MRGRRGESEGFLESQGEQQRSPCSAVGPTRDARISMQVFREFAVPALHCNDLRLEREMRNTIATRNETPQTRPRFGELPAFLADEFDTRNVRRDFVKFFIKGGIFSPYNS